uniref:NB-ARC domain-containing protein n=1 Tax=Salix viminalis TaxID=40686 RepID=A0A6N2K4E9_SALVM
MEALQVISSATEIISSMVGAVSALDQAYRNLDEAPKRIRSLEEFVYDLENLTRGIRQKHVYKLHNPQLDHQIQSLNALIEQLRPNIAKARRIVSRSRMKNLAKVVWSSVAGDPLSKLINTIRDDLNWWLESQRLTQHVQKVIESTAQDVPVRLKIKVEQGWPISSKCHFVRNLLEQEDSQRVILIVGLSGIGKSCLARQVASNPPTKFVGGAVEVGFGQWCSRNACNGNKDEYHRRLARKVSNFLVQIGFWKKIRDENNGDLDYVCCLLQEALYGKSIVILLDDVWEQDIVERFAKLYDNDCRYLVTTRNEAGIAETLLERCGHHPLTVAVMGKALRKEVRAEKWEKAITNLSTFATCAPGPVSYVNEKEAESTLTIFGSFEFSLEAMPGDSRRLFIALASLSWAEPVPEACLEAVWSVLGEESLFPLIVCKLVEGSLLIKTEMDPLYLVHDMVSLYLASKADDSTGILLNEYSLDETAFICPWLLIFGKENVKKIAEERMEFLFNVSEGKQVVATLEALVQALMASKSMSELEISRERFSRILGPRIADLISTDSLNLVAVTTEAITNIFSKSDYCNYFPSLETTAAISKLTATIEYCEENPMIQINILIVLAKLAEFGSHGTVDKVLESIPFDQIAGLLSSGAEKWHESLFTVLNSLTKAGKSNAVERMFASGIEKTLIKLLENGSEVVQHHAIVTLKGFYEVAHTPENDFLQPSNLNVLPWQVRLRLETFVLSDRAVPHSPKPLCFEDLVYKVLDGSKNQVLQAMQDLIPIIEKSADSRVREMILHSPLVSRLSELLQSRHSDHNSIRSESAFLLMKLAFSGGEPCIKKFLDHDIVPELVKMMQCNVEELQDSAYTALHQMLFGNGGILVLDKIFKTGFVDRMVQSVDSKSVKTREVNVHCILDLVELGNRSCLEQMLSLQVVEKLVKLENITGGSGETIVGFLKGMDKCKHLSMMERRVIKQQVVRKIRASLKGHKLETQILASVDASMSEGLKGSSSRYRK